MELSEEEAAAYYLDLVCDSNAAVAALGAAFTEKEAEFVEGGAPDPAAVKAAAAERITLNRMTLELLDDTHYVWPVEVRESLKVVRQTFMEELGVLNQIANSASYEDAYYAAVFPSTPEQQTAPQTIRYELGLSADTVASCEGHYGNLAVRHTEMVERG